MPFTLLLDYKETKSPQRELPDHQHDWYEFIYVYGGKGSFFSSIRPFMRCIQATSLSFPEIQCTGDSPTMRSR
ncbi:hypothetical protein ACFSQ7_32690 [Paenibacillus rhizoplanae]